MAKGAKNVVVSPSATRLRIVTPGEGPLCEWGDEALMLEYGKGSGDAFTELLRRHQRGVLNFMYRMVQNRHIAEELTQEVFIAIVKNAGRYVPTAKFTTYLYTIASNIVSKEWARRKRRPALFSLSRWLGPRDQDTDFSPAEHVGDKSASVLNAFQYGEISEAVNAALMHLPEKQRESFVLRRVQELTYEEVASILGIPVGTVKSRVVRAEKALRPYLEKFREYV